VVGCLVSIRFQKDQLGTTGSSDEERHGVGESVSRHSLIELSLEGIGLFSRHHSDAGAAELAQQPGIVVSQLTLNFCAQLSI
jgi:hypothetical protein